MFVLVGFSSNGSYRIMDTEDWVIEEIPSSTILQAIIDGDIDVKGIDRKSYKVKRGYDIDIEFIPWMLEISCKNLDGRNEQYYYDGYMVYTFFEYCDLDSQRRKSYVEVNNFVKETETLDVVVDRFKEALRFANQDYYMHCSFNPQNKMISYRIDDVREDNLVFKPVFYVNEDGKDWIYDFFDIVSLYTMEDKTAVGLEVKDWDSFTFNGREYTISEQLRNMGYDRFNTKRLIVDVDYQTTRWKVANNLRVAGVTANNIDDFFQKEKVVFDPFVCVRNVFDGMATGTDNSYRPFCDRFRGRLRYDESTMEIICDETGEREKLSNCVSKISPFSSAFSNEDVAKIKKAVSGMRNRVKLLCTDDDDRRRKLRELELNNHKSTSSMWLANTTVRDIGGDIHKLDRTVWYETVSRPYSINRFIGLKNIPLLGFSSKQFMMLETYDLRLDKDTDVNSNTLVTLTEAYRVLDSFPYVGNRRLIPLCITKVTNPDANGAISVDIRCLISLKGVKYRNYTFGGVSIDRAYLLINYPLILSPFVVEDFKDYYRLRTAFEDVYFSKDFMCNRLYGCVSSDYMFTDRNLINVNFPKYQDYMQSLLTDAMKLLDAELFASQDEYY